MEAAVVETRRKTIDALRQALVEDGMTEDVSDEVLRFVIEGLHTSSVNLENIERPTYSFLIDAHKVLSRKKFGMLFEEALGKNPHQKKVLQRVEGLLAFGIVPQTEEEKEFQVDLLKRLAVDPMSVGSAKLRGLPKEIFGEDFQIAIDSPYVHERSGQQNIIVEANDYAATDALLWREVGAELETFIATGETSGDNLVLEKDDEQDRRSKDDKEQVLFYVFGGKDGRKVGHRNQEQIQNVIEKIDPEARKQVEAELSRFLTAVRHYRKILAEKGIASQRVFEGNISYREKDANQDYDSHSRHPLIRHLIQSMTERLIEHIPDKGEDESWYLHSGIHNQLMIYADTAIPFEDHLMFFQKVEALKTRPDSSAPFTVFEEKNKKIEPVLTTHRPKNLPAAEGAKDSFSYPHLPVDKKDNKWQFTELFKAKLAQRPELKPVEEELRSWRGTAPPEFQALVLGEIVPFGAYPRHAENPTAEQRYRLWRLVADVYKEEWKDLEQVKRIDEQLSHWEWMDGNPLGVNERAVNDFHFHSSGESRQQWVPGVGTIRVSALERSYPVDRKGIDHVTFSWPLFFHDTWEGNHAVLYPKDKEKQAAWEKVAEAYRDELIRIVHDETNLQDVLDMQPGFFKEFFLEKKLEVMGVERLDDIENWLDYFAEHSHEGTEKNHVPGRIENVRSESAKKKRDELVFQVLMDTFDITEKQAKRQFALQEGAGIEQSSFKIDILWRTKEERVDGKYVEDVIVERKAFFDKQKDIIAEVKQRIAQEYARMDGLVLAREEDLFVFSDHVIENDESKLEIGPAYRLRMVSQPLMDWHVDALARASSVEDVEKLKARIDKDIPGKHPLKDMFIKNQFHAELWQVLKQEVPVDLLAELGISFERRDIDLNEVLKHMPEYLDHAFLKTYSLFEVKGIDHAFDQLPDDVAERIVHRLEQITMDEISSDMHPAFRRLLMRAEEKVRWPKLRRAAKKDPQVFESYRDRIHKLYPEPSYERDDLLEGIGMELAQTPEQIRRVWHDRYDEQVKWPDDNDSSAVRNQFKSFEYMQMGLGNMKRAERAAYLLWFMGGDTPHNEQFSIEGTGISLDGRKEMFWGMTKTERRHFLYDLFVGEEGILDTDKYTNSYLQKQRQEMVEHVSQGVFDLMFKDQLIDSSLPEDHETNTRGKEMLEIIFTQLFLQQETSARRSELMISIVKAFADQKEQGADMSPGVLIRLLLEQVGVVGVKTGQVLSEQPGLLPASINAELEKLKDEATPFSKRGSLAYLEGTGWVQGNEGKMQKIGEMLGSASIKKVDEGILQSGERVAIKAKRPSIDKNFEADLRVLRGVLSALNEKGFDVPPYLLDEVERVSRDELDFSHEVENQERFAEVLKRRGAHIGLQFGNQYERLPISVAKILDAPDAGVDAAELGLIVEEYVQGLPLKDIINYKTALERNDRATIKKMQDRVLRVYGEQSIIPYIEKQVRQLDVDRVQATLGLELLRETVKDGMFHADLHGGNIYIDFHPLSKQVTLIDLGSMGFSTDEHMPEYAREGKSQDYDARGDFRDFLTSFFAPEMRYDIIEKVVNKYAGFAWGKGPHEEPGEYAQKLVANEPTTEAKVKKILYTILEQANSGVDNQFRYFLKAIATAAGHLDKLKAEVQKEIAEDDENNVHAVTLKLMNEELINPMLLMTKEQMEEFAL